MSLAARNAYLFAIQMLLHYNQFLSAPALRNYPQKGVTEKTQSNDLLARKRIRF